MLYVKISKGFLKGPMANYKICPTNPKGNVDASPLGDVTYYIGLKVSSQWCNAKALGNRHTHLITE